MALCSQALSASTTKRSCPSLSNIYSTPNKRICLNGKVPAIGGIGFKDFYYSSSSEDDDSDEEDHPSFDSIQVRKKLIPRRSSVALAITGSETEIENFDCHQISQDEGADQNNNAVPIADTKARTRCFEYLIGAIDEAWARYCDAAASVEDDVYGYGTNSKNIAVSDDEDDDDASVDDDTFDNNTDITDYSDFPSQHHLAAPSKPAPQQPNQSSNQLQDLKVRLTKAKYYLQELVDSNDYREIELFWKRWDMIKYSTIELVEDDDDDEIIESTIEELENGRLFL
ncbi:hypothetical protein Cantr_09685 [Candida viswanathii]|jgi:hypothetical protein|uniref:Uncharacterized protein n=1 Tax=Candida viswanathii TaxID=5486 RepID=A0A367YCI4_9ASCO|nr:hypothetical protein Cantr_09685 [Candida viswanathii]